jgi:hypothetical protein
MAPSMESDLQQRLILSEHDITLLYWIGGYTLGIFFLWNMPGLKHVLYPFKLIVTALHEFGHASVGYCTGAKIKAIKIDADTGGVTEMVGGNSYLTLPAGYLGSSFYGGLMVFAGFNLMGSRIIAALVGLCVLLILYWSKNWIARGVSVAYLIVMGVLAWWNDSFLLPYFVLFLGYVLITRYLS